jgi:TPP-dependent pyruvate/acetoin dehydrogenase alpha subunit
MVVAMVAVVCELRGPNTREPSQLPDETLVEWYSTMIMLNTMDTILYEAQRHVSATGIQASGLCSPL